MSSRDVVTSPLTHKLQSKASCTSFNLPLTLLRVSPPCSKIISIIRLTRFVILPILLSLSFTASRNMVHVRVSRANVCVWDQPDSSIGWFKRDRGGESRGLHDGQHVKRHTIRGPVLSTLPNLAPRPSILMIRSYACR